MAVGSLLFLLLSLVIAAFIGAVIWFMAKTMSAPAAEQPDFTPDGERRSPHAGNIPACGKCGYPARGLNTFECPECGADLREVGIVTGAKHSAAANMLVVALVYSVVFLIASITVWSQIESRLPFSVNANARLKLRPASDQYRALVRIETEETIWGDESYSNSLGFTLSSLQHPPRVPLSTTLEGLTPGMRMTLISVTVDPTSPTPGARHRPELVVDPVTREASWSDWQGNRYQSQGVFTDQDVLAFFASAGVDQADPNVINESKQLYVLLDGLAQNKDQFTLLGFSISGGGGGTSGGGTAGWYLGLYLLIAFALWIIGLIWIARRAKRKAAD